jgi:Holliday junction resolvase-like predicted endonuclease
MKINSTTNIGQNAEGRVADLLSRSTEKQGSGFDYITSKKIKQMQYAAEIWVRQNEWDGDYRIAAAEVSEAANTIKVVEVI